MGWRVAWCTVWEFGVRLPTVAIDVAKTLEYQDLCTRWTTDRRPPLYTIGLRQWVALWAGLRQMYGHVHPCGVEDRVYQATDPDGTSIDLMYDLAQSHSPAVLWEGVHVLVTDENFEDEHAAWAAWDLSVKVGGVDA